MLRQRLYERLCEPHNLWGVKVSDDEAEKSSGRQRGHLVASIAGLEFGSGRRCSVGYEQRHGDAMEMEDEVPEAAALIDTRVSFDRLERPINRRQLQRRQLDIRRTVPAASFVERNGTLREIEAQSAILMIAGRHAGQRGEARSRTDVAHQCTAARHQNHTCRHRPPRSQH